MRVDLPEPFWPMSAWISPARMSIDTSSSARVAPKVFDSRATRNASAPGGATVAAEPPAVAAESLISLLPDRFWPSSVT